MSEKGKPVTIIGVDLGIGESWSVVVLVGPPVEEGGDFTITSVHEGAWPSNQEGKGDVEDE